MEEKLGEVLLKYFSWVFSKAFRPQTQIEERCYCKDIDLFCDVTTGHKLTLGVFLLFFLLSFLCKCSQHINLLKVQLCHCSNHKNAKCRIICQSFSWVKSYGWWWMNNVMWNRNKINKVWNSQIISSPTTTWIQISCFAYRILQPTGPWNVADAFKSDKSFYYLFPLEGNIELLGL